ncbi:hypothetical protein D9C73_023603 [Xyrichtys novacula]|uniref:Transmembrane protein n=1 Tax=Xyrichtys novacula TaxID=13765 RepID=A0AAV1H3E9_XYRNO|nr:hypothetical protein D9C73_023603 [Xyrichtys novacula]
MEADVVVPEKRQRKKSGGGSVRRSHVTPPHWTKAIMKQHQLSRGKRLTKPILFGTLIVGLAAAFFNRHRFFEDVEELKAQERARNEAKRIEILERRQRQLEEAAEKRRAGSS